MSPADVLSPVDATAAVERSVAELLGGAPADGDAELRMLDAVAGIAGWWSFAAQLPEIEY